MQEYELLRGLVFVAVCAVPVVAVAGPKPLAGDDLKSAFSGSTIELDTPFSATLSIRFSEDGLMAGQSPKLAVYLGAAKDRGRWWVKNDRLCYKWFRWFEAEPHCLSVRVQDDRVFWRRDDGRNGTATITTRAAPPPTIQAVQMASVPVLKSPPQLVVRQKATSVLSQLDAASADVPFGFFGVGRNLALALPTIPMPSQR
jgi:hypothetical protein